MKEKELLEKIKDIIIEVLEYENEEDSIIIKPESSLIGGVGNHELGISSIDYVEILAMVEEKFDIVYDFDERIETVGELINYIQRFEREKNDKQ